MMQPAVPVVDVEPKGKGPHPAFLGADTSGRLDEIRLATVNVQLDEFSGRIRPRNLRGDHPLNVERIRLLRLLAVGAGSAGDREAQYERNTHGQPVSKATDIPHRQ